MWRNAISSRDYSRNLTAIQTKQLRKQSEYDIANIYFVFARLFQQCISEIGASSRIFN